MSRPEGCICDYNPETTQGPEEDCPHHGRPYAYWVEASGALHFLVEQLTAERDRARDMAVALEQQAAALTSALNVALYYAINPGPRSHAAREELEGCGIALSDAVAP